MKNAALVVAMCLLIAATVHAAPQIHVDEPIHDFGEIQEGFAVAHVFTIENRGDELLEIHRVAASCGCTTTALATNRLAPGASVDLELLLDTTGFGGLISKSITIYCNDPDYADTFDSDRPRFRVRVTGEVIRAQAYHTTITDMNYLFYAVVDLRDADAYDDAHLLGAVNLPYDQLDERLHMLPKDAMTVLIDQRGEVAKAASTALVDLGYDTIYYTVGGFDEWTRWYGEYLVDAGNGFEPASREGRERLSCAEPGTEPPYCTDVEELRYLAYVLVDLRDSGAYAEGHLFGAINIPHAQLLGRLDDLPKDVLIILYGDGNERSDTAALTMQNEGFTQARSLLGGLDEWTRQFGERYVIARSE